jgi:hypothetical protein
MRNKAIDISYPEERRRTHTHLIMSDWKETAPGRFERPTDSLEAFYIATAKLGQPLGAEHLAFSFGLQIQHQYADLIGALQYAWIRVREEHPKLAATVDSSNLVYQKLTPDQSSIDAYLTETFKVIGPPVKSATELFPSLNAPAERAVLYYLPASSEIVIHTAHWRIDGIGALQILDQLLCNVVAAHSSHSSLSSLLSGAEEANLTPGFDTVLNLDAQPPESVTAVSNNALANFGAHQPALSIPPSTAPPSPSATTHRQQIVFSPSLSSAISAAAKERGISVTVAAHAALIHAAKSLKAADSPATSYTSWVAFSVRNMLPEQYQGPAYAVTCAHTGWPLALQPTDFRNDTYGLQKFYQESSSPEMMASLRAFHNTLTALLSQPLPPGAPIPAYPALNSIGIVDNIIKSTYGEGDGVIKTSNFWLGNAVTTLDIWVHIWNWQGQITLSGLHNIGVYDDQKINEFLQKVKDILVTELGVTE